MTYPFLHEIARHTALLEYRDSPMSERMQATVLEAQLLEGRRQLMPDVVFRMRRLISGLNNTASVTSIQVLC